MFALISLKCPLTPSSFRQTGNSARAAERQLPYDEKGIDVRALAVHPELDLRDVGCWLSKETDTNFSRIACVEILSRAEKSNGSEATGKLLTSTFSTLNFLIEQASLRGIPVRKIVMPILGAGKQKIDLNYLAPVLFSQMKQVLAAVDELTDIYIYDRNPEKIRQFSEVLSRIYNKSGKQTPDVFISYSTKQDNLAHKIFETLTKRGISCWIAPESIAPGSNYMLDIASGIGNTKLTVLVLTPDAEESPWVMGEVEITKGSRHCLIPYQEHPYDIGANYKMYLVGSQILEAWKHSGDAMSYLADCVCDMLEKTSR